MKKVGIALIITILIGLVACTPIVTEVSNAVVLASSATLQSEKTRIETPEVSGSEQADLTDGNGAFAFDLYQQLKTREGNLFYSPYSISAALAMTYAGAGGATAEQMAGALHFDLPQNKLHPAFNWLENELARRGEGAEGKDEEGFRLNVVNAIWGQKGYEFRVTFLDTLAENYGVGLRILNFIDEPDKSRITINDWVSEQTEERINDLIPPDGITPLTRLVLTNAIYFNAAWENQFNEEATTDLPFYLRDGGSVIVPMMRQTESLGYTEGDNFQAVELPYDGEELSMVILLPDEGKFTEFENSLDFRQADRIIDRLDDKRVKLTMPKFEFESDFSLKQALSALGMAEAFSGSADFSGMTGNNDLFIGDVIHKAFVSVDENGTEAAAATAVTMVMSAPGPTPEEPVTVTIDRPYIFLIRDIETGVILFIGRVLTPTAITDSIEKSENPPNAVFLEVKIYAEHHGLTVDEALRRFEIQDAFAGLDTELSMKEPETFAGLYIQHEPEFRIVALFTREGEEIIEPYIPDGMAEYVEVRTVEVSFLELQNAQNEVLSVIRSLDIPADSGIDVKENKVKFYVTDLTPVENAISEGTLTVHDYVVFIEVEALAQPE